MKKYALICLLTCLSILSKAQKTDTVAEKISNLQFTSWEIYPSCTQEPIEQFIVHNFKRPESLKSDFNGNVIASILIDRKGNYRDLELLKNQSKELDQEALRVLSLAKWLPAIYDSEPINFNVVIDIKIHYDSIKNIFKVNPYTRRNTMPVNRNGVAERINVPFNLDVLPSFPGGEEAFAEYVKKHFTYPQNANGQRIQGRVLVDLVVEEDGSLTNFHVFGTYDQQLALQVLSMLKKCPKFIPVSTNGKMARFPCTLPINFN